MKKKYYNTEILTYFYKKPMVRIALYQPEIPQNTGTILRMCACFGIEVDIIEPCGFILNDKLIKRSAMDYLKICKYNRFQCWDDYLQALGVNGNNSCVRIIATTPCANINHNKFEYQENDVLLFGSESSGLPNSILNQANCKIKIPMVKGVRSLNLAVSCAIILSAGLQKLNIFDDF